MPTEQDARERAWEDNGLKYVGGSMREYFNNGFDAGWNARSEENAWVKCSDRLPEYGEDVVFIVAGCVAHYEYLNGRILGGRFTPPLGFAIPGMTFNASHWMSLPELPAEEPKP